MENCNAKKIYYFSLRSINNIESFKLRLPKEKKSKYVRTHLGVLVLKSDSDNGR